jgi:hypothetical protein
MFGRLEIVIQKVISHVESGNFKYALRFEEKLYKTLIPPNRIIDKVRSIHRCSVNTARAICATSWGYYQLLGLNLYSVCQYNDLIFKFLNDDYEQEKAFNEFCKAKGILLSEVERDLRHLSVIATQISTKRDSSDSYIKLLRNHIRDHINGYRFLTDFVNKYNGAPVGSESFFSYLLRMLYYFKRIVEGGEL